MSKQRYELKVSHTNLNGYYQVCEGRIGSYHVVRLAGPASSEIDERKKQARLDFILMDNVKARITVNRKNGLMLSAGIYEARDCRPTANEWLRGYPLASRVTPDAYKRVWKALINPATTFYVPIDQLDGPLPGMAWAFVNYFDKGFKLRVEGPQDKPERFKERSELEDDGLAEEVDQTDLGDLADEDLGDFAFVDPSCSDYHYPDPDHEIRQLQVHGVIRGHKL
ncbi:MAG: hypothetical protein KJ709_09360 [Nanoarchaeota archaeon]|nr:hypothetical protein [Nanoarchaeota archaeon]